MRTTTHNSINAVLLAVVILIFSGYGRALAIPPAVFVKPSQIDFGLDKHQSFFTIANYDDFAGTFRLRTSYNIQGAGNSGTVDESKRWLLSDKQQIELGPGEETTVALSVDRSRGASGINSAAVLVDVINPSDNSSDFVAAVRVSAAMLTMVPRQIDFGTDKTESAWLIENQTDSAGKWRVRILYKNKNTGDYTLAKATPGWLRSDKEYIELGPHEETAVSLAADRKNYAPGTYYAALDFIAITAADNDTDVYPSEKYFVRTEVRLSIKPEPKLEIEQVPLILTWPYDTRDVFIKNSGNSDLKWSMGRITYTSGSDSDWLRIAPSYGAVPAGEKEQITIGAGGETPSRDYISSADLQIESNGGNVTISVSLFVPMVFRHEKLFGSPTAVTPLFRFLVIRDIRPIPDAAAQRH